MIEQASFVKVASAVHSTIDTAGKGAAVGIGGGVAAGDFFGWLNANAVALGLLVAFLSWVTSSVLSYWFKSRLLKIAERQGVGAVAGIKDE